MHYFLLNSPKYKVLLVDPICKATFNNFQWASNQIATSTLNFAFTNNFGSLHRVQKRRVC